MSVFENKLRDFTRILKENVLYKNISIISLPDNMMATIINSENGIIINVDFMRHSCMRYCKKDSSFSINDYDSLEEMTESFSKTVQKLY